MRVRKRPVEVEAMQLLDSNARIVADWCGGSLLMKSENWMKTNEETKFDIPYIEILTLEGVMTARLRDYIIRGVHGEFYPVAPDIFEQTYEVIEE